MRTLILNEMVIFNVSRLYLSFFFPRRNPDVLQAGHSLDFCGGGTGQSPARGSLTRVARGFQATVFIYLFSFPFLLSLGACRARRTALYDGRGNLLGSLDLFLIGYRHARDLVN